MLIIRLQPTGRKKRISYRIVVDEKRSKLVGKYVDLLGYYNPFGKKPEFSLNREKYEKWIKNGAQVSQRVSQLIQKFSS